MNKIIIGKRWDTDAIYCGRPTPLGNPFYLKDLNDDKERELVCQQYEKYLKKKIKDNDKLICDEIKRLF